MSETDTSFEQALERVALPLARVMTHHGVTIAQATEILKQAYVSAALGVAGASATDSRISLLTGIHRKDVKRLRESDPRPPRRPMLNAVALGVAIWSTHPEFRTKDGTPTLLSRTGSPSIDDLVKTARIDLPTSTLIEALKEQGLIEGDDPFALTHGTTSRAEGRDLMIMAFEKNLRAHLSAVADNLTAEPDAKQFERAAHFNQLSAASIEKLEEEAEQKLGEVLLHLNQMALALQDEDASSSEAMGRFSVGGYLNSQKPEPSSGSANGDDDAQ